ncbi:MAG: SUMF1/EgtB/PvdO family nonheme iron enzyme [Pseudomonadota bacterium]
MNEKKHGTWFGAAVFLFLVFLGGAVFAESLLIQRPEVEIKGGQGAFFPTIYKAVKGETLEILGEEKGWYKVKTPKGDGWVFGQALAEKSSSFDPNAAISGTADSSDLDKTAGFKADRYTTEPTAPAVEPAAPAAEQPRPMVNSIGMEFVSIPAGTFRMGSPDEENERGLNEDAHEVTISKPFFLQAAEVTIGQWKKVMGQAPSGSPEGSVQEAAATNVSWNMAQEFIFKLNALENTTKYRLPTEAEWEYACRAGSETAYFFGDDPKMLPNYAWFQNNSDNSPHAVRQKQPNPWGLFDMSGNVSEWCQDIYGQYETLKENVTDPAGSSVGDHRVIRGGSRLSGAPGLRSSARNEVAPDYSAADLGFRVAKDF